MRKQQLILVASAILTGALITFAHSTSRQWQTALILILMATCNAVAWNLASGYAGVFSLGHHVFFGIGAYTSTLLFQKAQITPWIGILASGLLAAAAGALIALVTFRYKLTGVFFGLTTMALGEVARSIASSWKYIGSTTGLFLPLRDDPANFLFKSNRLAYFYIILTLLLLYVLITYLIGRSKVGYYLKAIREDQQAAEASGVNSYRYKTLIMALSAGLTGMVGTFYAQYMQFIDPNIVFRFDIQLDMMLGVMVGGPGTIVGPLLGSGLFGFLGEFLRDFGSSARMAATSRVVYAFVLMLVALYLPAGLISLKLKGNRKPPTDGKGGAQSAA